MGRPRGTKAGWVPVCPRHPGSSVTLASRYGKNGDRQRYRCRPADGGAPHTFAGGVPRLVAEGHTCAHCGGNVERHQGPVVARHHDFPVEAAAHALVLVGRGMSYTEAANRVRIGHGKRARPAGAQLVANWVETLGPVAAAPRRETSWPETVVLDSTNFIVVNRAMGTRSQAFAILAAWGYDRGAKTGRCLALWATPQARAREWQQFLGRLPGEPVLAISDAGGAIAPAVAATWPSTFHKFCEHHLRENARRHLDHYGLAVFGTLEMALLNDAFSSAAGWRAFKKATRRLAVTGGWVRSVDAMVTEQARRRAKLPQHHSTGALDEAIGKVREFIEPRAFCYRNAERTNRMLELVRLRLNLADDEQAYARAIREHLEPRAGQLPEQGAIRDPQGVYSLRD